MVFLLRRGGGAGLAPVGWAPQRAASPRRHRRLPPTDRVPGRGKQPPRAAKHVFWGVGQPPDAAGASAAMRTRSSNRGQRKRLGASARERSSYFLP